MDYGLLHVLKCEKTEDTIFDKVRKQRLTSYHRAIVNPPNPRYGDIETSVTHHPAD